MEWALRDYGGHSCFVWDGNPNCGHKWGVRIIKSQSGGIEKAGVTNCKDKRIHFLDRSSYCMKCGAWRGQLGMEPSINLYIKHLCDIFDEVKRVLKPAGTCWVNLGDTYSGSGCGTNDYKTEASRSIQGKNTLLNKTGGIAQRINEVPAKSLCLMPFRFALEMVKRKWTLRNVIIWHKPNCMPSSAKDRFTVDFEYLFFFVKSKRYYFKKCYEPWMDKKKHDIERAGKAFEYTGEQKYNRKMSVLGDPSKGRNKRCVWLIPTTPFPDAHFATFPAKLCETPIKSGCPPKGIVMDPFMGSGTTGLTALKHGANFVGIETNPKYIEMARNRMGGMAKGC